MKTATLKVKAEKGNKSALGLAWDGDDAHWSGTRNKYIMLLIVITNIAHWVIKTSNTMSLNTQGTHCGA